jgi:hypothetical protein
MAILDDLEGMVRALWAFLEPNRGQPVSDRGAILRKRWKTSKNVTESPPDGELDDIGGIPEIQRLPWETPGEYAKFRVSLMQGPARTVRQSYRAYCRVNGIEPKANPPSTWYDLYNGRYAAFRKAEWQYKAIERAGEVHNRFPNWEKLEAIIDQEIELEKYKGGEFYEIMLDLALINLAFHALAIDNAGNPLPGVLTWEERAAAYWAAVERGEAEPPG